MKIFIHSPKKTDHLTQGNPVSIDKLKVKFQRLKEKETCLHLHGTTLSEYWHKERVPRGLRIKKEPTVVKNCKTFIQRYDEILNKCPLDLMLLIIEVSAEMKRLNP